MRGDGQMRSNKTQTFFGAARDTQKKLPLFERPGRSHSFWVFFFFSFFFLFSCWQPHIFKNVRVRYEPERKERREEWTDVFSCQKPSDSNLKGAVSPSALCTSAHTSCNHVPDNRPFYWCSHSTDTHLSEYDAEQ